MHCICISSGECHFSELKLIRAVFTVTVTGMGCRIPTVVEKFRKSAAVFHEEEQQDLERTV